MSQRIFLTLSIILAVALGLHFFSSNQKSSIQNRIESQEPLKTHPSLETLSENTQDKQPLKTKNRLNKDTVTPQPSSQILQIDFDQIKNRQTSKTPSQFSKSYKLIVEDLNLSSQPQKIKIQFDRVIPNVTSVIIMGSEGESTIQDMSYNNQSLSDSSPSTVLFKEDWIRSKPSFSSLENIEFIANAQTQSSINIYLQIIGDQ